MGYKNFHTELKFGKEYELKSLQFFDNFTDYTQSEGDVSEWDIKLDNGECFECKADRYTLKTGNICIEYATIDKDTRDIYNSGLSVSTSDYWIYWGVDEKNEENNKVWKIPTEQLREIVYSKPRKSRNLGNGWRSICYLIPSEEFEDYLIHPEPK